VQVAVMLDKQRRDAVAKADFVGFPVGDDFVIGYGMDDAGRYRGLPISARCRVSGFFDGRAASLRCR
jgi:hypoxanthine-guanine phosphoribosyltransferase